MTLRATPLHQSIEDAVDAALQVVLGATDPRTLTPGDFRSLRAHLDATGLLQHPLLAAILGTRHICAAAVLAPPPGRPAPTRPVACPPVQWSLAVR